MADRIPVIWPIDEYYNIPLRAFNLETEIMLWDMLNANCDKITMRCPVKTYCDIRGLIVALGYTEKENDLLSYPSPAEKVFRIWKNDVDNQRTPSIGMLIELLHQLERYDILYELETFIKHDVEAWLEELKFIEKYEKELRDNQLIQLRNDEAREPHPIPDHRPIDIIRDDEDETVYDAVFSYDTKSDYALGVMRQMKDVLSGFKYRYRLCEGITRLRPGVHELEGYTTLVDKLCRHVIVLLTRSYLNSEDYNFQLLYAKGKDRMAYKRKVIPVLLEYITVPPILTDIVCVNFYKVGERDDCYRAIADGLRQREPNANRQNKIEKDVVKEDV